MQRFKNFFSELRRRRVGRVAVAYVVVAWLMVEVADTIIPRLLLPEWTVSVLIGLALIGLPVAVMLAWWFDIVPDARSGGGKRRWIGPALLSVVILAGAAFASRIFLPRLIDPTDIQSIVVLPFTNTGSAAEEEFFISGVHRELIAQLSQLSSLRVISPRSAMRYKASVMSIPEIAQQLRVDAIVEGSVARNGSNLRVQVALIQPFPEERQVWSQTFTRPEREVNELHADIARDIARQIEVELTPDEEKRLSEPKTVDPRVYELYLRGMHHINIRGTRDDVQTGLRYLRDAIDVDPADARSYAAMANVYATMGHAWVHLPDSWSQARAAAERALALDPNQAEAHAAIAKIKIYHEWDWQAADAAFKRALALNPSLAETRSHYAYFHMLFDRVDDAVREHELAQKLDPFTPGNTAWLALLYTMADRPDDALRSAQQAADLFPRAPGVLASLGNTYADRNMAAEAIATHQRLISINPRGKWFLGAVYAQLGQKENALRIAAELQAEPITPFVAYGLGEIYARLGDLDRAFHWLNHGEPHAWLPWVRVLPGFAALRADPRYKSLLERMKLPS